MPDLLAYPFTQAEALRAYDEWGANCGPNALAFILQVPLESVRHAIPGFEEKRYTSPTMMAAGIRSLGRTATAVHTRGSAPTKDTMFGREPFLVRVQFTGPWTQPGANPKWAYWHTHWIVTYMVERQAPMVFDCNGGIRGYQEWEREIVPLLTGSIKRADGNWFPTDVWRID